MYCLFTAIWHTSVGCDRWVWTSGWIMISWDTLKKLRGNLVLVPLHLQSISLKISWDWMWGSAVRSQHFLRPAPQLPCNNMWSLWAKYRPQEEFQHENLWGQWKCCAGPEPKHNNREEKEENTKLNHMRYKSNTTVLDKKCEDKKQVWNMYLNMIVQNFPGS